MVKGAVICGGWASERMGWDDGYLNEDAVRRGGCDAHALLRCQLHVKEKNHSCLSCHLSARVYAARGANF